jgi:rhamnose transport system ATP-binding protein
MVGHDLSALFPKQDVQPGAVVLEVDGLSRAGVFQDITFSVRAGEIVALAGLVGSGRSEVMRAVFGVDPYDSGRVTVLGRRLRSGSPRAAMAAGMALVPEDRRQQGLIMELSVQRNVTLPRSGRLSHLGLLVGSAERDEATRWTRRPQTRLRRLSGPVGTLSGGNQQKVVLAKWLSTAPRLLIVDEPTRGIDVGTKAEVHRLMSALAADGVGRRRRPEREAQGRLEDRLPAEAAEQPVLRRGGRRRQGGGRRAQPPPTSTNSTSEPHHGGRHWLGIQVISGRSDTHG